MSDNSGYIFVIDKIKALPLSIRSEKELEKFTTVIGLIDEMTQKDVLLSGYEKGVLRSRKLTLQEKVSAFKRSVRIKTSGFGIV